MDEIDILAYLEKLNENISLLRKEIKEMKIIFDKLPEIAEKDKEVLSTYLSKIKNSVDDVKIELSNFELFLKIGLDKIRKELESNMEISIKNTLNSYFESELPKILYAAQKILNKNQINIVQEVLEKSIKIQLNPIIEKINELNERIDVLTLISAKEKEDKLKIYLLTTKSKEIKKKDLEKTFGKEIVEKVLKEIGGVLKVKIV